MQKVKSKKEHKWFKTLQNNNGVQIIFKVSKLMLGASTVDATVKDAKRFGFSQDFYISSSIIYVH